MTEVLAKTDAPDPTSTRGLIGAGLAVTAWGSGTIIAKAMEMGGLSIAAYRFALYFVILVVWMRVRGTPFTARVIRHSMYGGIALGLDVALFFSAVKLTSVVNATVIGSLQPVLVGVVAARFFGERIRASDALWSVVALAGVMIVVVSTAGSATSSRAGDLLAVGALLSWSAYFIASKQSKSTMSSTEFTAGTALWASAINFPLALAFGQDLSFPSTNDVFLLLLLTFIAGVIGHSLMNWSLVLIPLWVGSTFTLLIPVASSLLAWLFLGEALGWWQAIGMGVVIGPMAAIVVGQSRTKDDTITP